MRWRWLGVAGVGLAAFAVYFDRKARHYETKLRTGIVG